MPSDPNSADSAKNLARRLDLIGQYFSKPVRLVLQIDGDAAGDDPIIRQAMGADQEGYTTESDLTWELSDALTPVRVQIARGASRKEVLGILRRIERMLETDWEKLTRTKASEMGEDWREDYDDLFSEL